MAGSVGSVGCLIVDETISRGSPLSPVSMTYMSSSAASAGVSEMLKNSKSPPDTAPICGMPSFSTVVPADDVTTTLYSVDRLRSSLCTATTSFCCGSMVRPDARSSRITVSTLPLQVWLAIVQGSALHTYTIGSSP